MKTKAKATLGLSKLTPEAKVVKAQAIIDAMQSSGNFPASQMPMSYPDLQTLITGLHNANVQASNGSSTDISDMHEQERMLTMAFNLIKAHVEIVSNTFINPEAMILSSGMALSAPNGQSGISGLTLEATGGGAVQIRVPRNSGDKSYWYQYSPAGDPANWQTIGYSSLSKYELSNQVPGTLLNIRYAPIGSAGLGAFSASKQVMVV